jgi:AcrR family transcriptional regulator
MSGKLIRRQPSLPGEVKERSQRERLLWAMVHSVAEHGYEGASVDDAVARAGLERLDFGQLFADKDACILAAYDWLLDQVLARVAESYRVGYESSWPEGIRSGLEALLQSIAEEPGAARMAALEVPSAGWEAHARHRAVIERIVPYLGEGREYSSRAEELPAQAEMMALGGAEAIIFDEIACGAAEQLPALLPEILFAILVPFLGPEGAAAEMYAAVPVG